MASCSMRWIISGSMTCWLIGMVWPWILMWIGVPAVMKMSEAFFSAINWKRLSKITRFGLPKNPRRTR